MAVSGLTMTRTSVQRDQYWRSAVQKNRSKGFSVGLGRCRFNTPSCCRRARTLIVASMDFCLRTAAKRNSFGIGGQIQTASTCEARLCGESSWIVTQAAGAK
jgi:hypothetical protein